MKRALKLLVLGAGVMAGATLAVRAEHPAPQGGGRGGAAAPPVNHETSNERSGIQIDQFVGSPVNSAPHLSHGGLLTRSILRHGNPNEPGPAGAVLEYRTQSAVATLLPHSGTPLTSLNNQFLFFVVNGEGRLDDGQQSWDLRKDVAVLIPPDVQRRFTNASDEPLEMVMVEWPANDVAREDILVRDANLLPWCEENAHWNNMSKCVFSQADGMTGRVLLVTLMPFTMAAPHPHRVGTEEIWTKLTPGTSLVLLGSDLREVSQFGAFLAPPNGITWHAQINTSKTAVDEWLYVAGGSAPPAPAAAGPGAAQAQDPTPAAGGRGGGRGSNPNLSRDPAVVERATVPGTPLE